MPRSERYNFPRGCDICVISILEDTEFAHFIVWQYQRLGFNSHNPFLAEAYEYIQNSGVVIFLRSIASDNNDLFRFLFGRAISYGNKIIPICVNEFVFSSHYEFNEYHWYKFTDFIRLFQKKGDVYIMDTNEGEQIKNHFKEVSNYSPLSEYDFLAIGLDHLSLSKLAIDNSRIAIFHIEGTLDLNDTTNKLLLHAKRNDKTVLVCSHDKSTASLIENHSQGQFLLLEFPMTSFGMMSEKDLERILIKFKQIIKDNSNQHFLNRVISILKTFNIFRVFTRMT